MVFDLIKDWLGLSDFLTNYPAYVPLAYIIAGVFALLCVHIFWCVLASLFSIFDRR